jgi:mono/diheme cytochrome c family protein
MSAKCSGRMGSTDVGMFGDQALDRTKPRRARQLHSGVVAMMKRRSLIPAAVAILSQSPALAGSLPADPDDAAQVTRGAPVYAEACASCHGAQLEGQGDWRTPNPDGTYPAPPHDADGHTWHHPDSLLFRYTKLGGREAMKDVPGVKSAMPGFGDVLSNQDIWDVLAFIKSHWPERAREYQRAMTENDN